MLPIDKEENCKRMLKTGQYQIPRSRGKEDKWLFSYLKRNGVSRDEAYKIWLPIFQTRHFSYRGEMEPLFIFDDLWEDTKRVRFKKRNEIIFYEKEINFLKNFDLPRWEKEYFMMLFATIKARGVNDFSDFLVGELIGFTSISGRRGSECNDVFSDGIKLKVFRHKSEKKWDSINGVFEKREYYVLPRLEVDGKEVFRFKSLVDVPDCFNEMFGFRICENCGKEFEINSKTKRNICKECWVKEEREKAKIRMRKLRKNVCSGE